MSNSHALHTASKHFTVAMVVTKTAVQYKERIGEYRTDNVCLSCCSLDLA